jgi:ComEC/Rec2-related protein
VTGIAVAIAALGGAGFGWWAVAAIGFGIIAAILLAPDHMHGASCALILAAAAIGAWRASATNSDSVSIAPVIVGNVVTVTTEPVRIGPAQYFIAGPDTKSADASSGREWTMCVSGGREPTVHLGDRIRLWGGSQSLDDVSLAQRSSLLKRGCGSRWYASHVEVIDVGPTTSRLLPTLQSNLDDALRASAPGDAGVLLSGLVTGDDSGFSQSREEALYRSGTTHITSVSGSNLALVVGMLAAIGTGTIGRHRLTWQLVTIGGVWIYALVAGAQPPSVRAAIVASAAVLAFQVGRRPDFVTLILLTAAAMVVVAPEQLSWLGFQLSVASSLALAIVIPAVLGQGRLGVVAAVVVATTIAQLATLPFLLPVIGSISLTTVLANLIVAPLVAIAMPLAATAGVLGLLSPPMGEIVAAPAALVAEITLKVIDALGGSSAAVRTGVPPREAAVIFALIAGVTICLLSSTGNRLVGGCVLNVMARVPIRSPSPSYPLLTRGSVCGPALLVPATARIVTWEDPTHALRADADHAIHQPAGQEHAHQVADEGQRTQTVSG